MLPRCPWCGSHTALERRVCDTCYQAALVIPELPTTDLDSLPFGVIELDNDGKVLAFNRTEEERACLEAEEVIGKNFFRDIAPCAQVKEYEGRFREFLASNEPAIEFSFIYTFPHGTVPIHIMFLRAQGYTILIVSKEKVA